MDYEKKYKDALAAARQAMGTGAYDDLTLEFIFPELNESEDERIRKAIHIYLDWLDGRKDYQPRGEYTIRDMIAWLVKQDEHDKWKPSKEEMDALYGLAYITNKMDDKKDEVITKLYQDLKREFFNGSSYENMFPKENKMSECDEDSVRRRSTIQILEYARSLVNYNQYGKADIDKNIAWLEKQGEKPNFCHHEVDLSGCSEEYRKAYYDGWNNCNQQHEQLKAEQKPYEPKNWPADKDNLTQEQKPTEWRYADNIGWDEAFACVTKAEKSAKNEEELQNAVTAEKWLKEIKFKYNVHPVKQEWSEEDEKTLDCIINVLDRLGFEEFRKSSRDKDVEDERFYYKEIQCLKRLKSLRPQPKQEWSEEDERIRKAIIGYIDHGQHYDVSNKDMIAWLEKQGKQKELACDRCRKAQPSHSCSDITALGRCYLEGEQKPAEWSEPEINGEPIPTENQSVDISVPEWSEEDKKMIKMILGDLEWERRNTTVDKDIRHYDEELRWLKSLSSNLKKRNEDIAKLCSNEWSEEDERIRKWLHDYIGNAPNDNFDFYGGMSKAEVLAWLEKQDTEAMKELYIRFGTIPEDENSRIYRGEDEVGVENGLSVYPAFQNKDGDIILGLTLPITKTTLYTQQHLLEYDNRPCYLVTGNKVGNGSDGEPLIHNVKIIREIEQYRIKESNSEKQKEQEPSIDIDNLANTEQKSKESESEFRRGYQAGFMDGRNSMGPGFPYPMNPIYQTPGTFPPVEPYIPTYTDTH